MLTWTHNRIRRCHNLRITRSSFWDIHKPTYSLAISVVSKSSLNQGSADTNKTQADSDSGLKTDRSKIIASLHSMNLFLVQKVVRGWTSQHALETMTEDVENNHNLDWNRPTSACYAATIKVCCTKHWNTNDILPFYWNNFSH